jgi:uncharacterized SAM-binding protein YcdF (DUF218 family)
MIRFQSARALTHALRALAQAIACALALLLLAGAMVVLQGQRDESRGADLALVLDSASGPDDAIARAQLDRAITLHRRGLVERILLTGASDTAAAERYLRTQGTPAEAILTGAPAEPLPERITRAADATRASGAASVIVIGEPAKMLRALKIARDRNLEAYGAPARAAAPGRTNLDVLRDTLRETWAYLGYLFLGQ